MLSQERSRIILKRIMSGPRPGVTLAVWEGVRSYAEFDTGVITATREQLADLAGTNVREVSRALSRLAEIKALIRVDRGHYRLHPGTAWAGNLAARERAAELLPAE